MAAGLAAIWPVMNAYIMDLFPDANMGGDFGATRTVFMGIGSIGPLTVGVVADVATFSMAFLGLALCLLASTQSSFFAPLNRGECLITVYLEFLIG